jgi:hypothetical protein
MIISIGDLSRIFKVSKLSQGATSFNIPSTLIMSPTDAVVEEDYEMLLEEKAIIESFQLKSAQSLLSFDANTSLSASSFGKSGRHYAKTLPNDI